MVLLGWENPLGWLAFLSLLPFLLLYLIRPKPQELEVPSLMFFMKSRYVDKERSFLKRFRFDIFFLLQLLILSLLALYFVDPFTSFGSNILVDHAVFVLDVSASMQVDDRFSEALDLVQERLGRTNTFILISNTPRVGAEDISKRDAAQFLKHLKVTAGRSNIGDALALASNYVKGEDTQVFVVSDFIPTEGVSIAAAKNALQAKNIVPEFLSVKDQKQHHNIGIVDVRVDESSSTVYFKNYGDREEQVAFSVNGEPKSVSIKPLFIEPYSFKTYTGVTEVSLAEEDDFLVDNVAYLSVPERKRISVLLITDKESKYLKAALQSSGKVDVTVTSTRTLPKGAFDVYALHTIKGKIGNDVLATLTREVEEGKGLVIHAEPASNVIDYGELLPLELSTYEYDAIVEIAQLTKLTKDILFGDVRRYFSTKNEQGLILATAHNSSVLTVYPLGMGKIIYYGLIEEESDFVLQPSYPIFWTNAIRYLAGQGTLSDFNVDSGSILSLPSKKEIRTPSKKLTTTTVLFDEIGLYTIDEKIIAVTLADETESDVDAVSNEASLASSALETAFAETSKYSLEKLILFAAGILLLLELLLMKFRGEV
ncbi:VWA domain-containing protein [Candidatus Woesearchaeota archaeon]|nr:VWA domain-containing protein [Candidatus Woesearchaeota archaeon]